MSENPRMLPWASYTASPMSASAAPALSVGAASDSIIVLSDVPASEPFSPALPSIASAVTISSIGCWLEANTAPDIFMAAARSDTSTLDAFAAAASMLATVPISLAGMLKAFMALAATSALSASPIPLAAAISSTPGSASITCAGARPAFASSNCACAASPAEKAVTAPISSACAWRAAICSPVAADTCAMTFMLCSNSPALETAAAPTATRGAVTPMLRPVPTLRMVEARELTEATAPSVSIWISPYALPRFTPSATAAPYSSSHVPSSRTRTLRSPSALTLRNACPPPASPSASRPSRVYLGLPALSRSASRFSTQAPN